MSASPSTSAAPSGRSRSPAERTATASPQPPHAPPAAASSSKRIEPAPAVAAKPKNLFTNDGSFLERFKKNSVPTPDQEKKEREEALARKKALEERFKRRGKRPSSAASAPNQNGTASPDDTDSKRLRLSTEHDNERRLTEYEKEVRKLESRHLKDQGSSLRPLMK
ncbi:hypothetical protein JCM10908_000456 [Rhodotorula pacifica]|uniref:uncharacterized protein n=1 Tax=Rhodotorula pacifica TaxID=1495444 RepID=UPI00317DBD35